MPNAQSVGGRVLLSEAFVTNIVDEFPSEAQHNERTGGLPRTYGSSKATNAPDGEYQMHSPQEDECNIADDRVTNIRVDFRAKHRVYNKY